MTEQDLERLQNEMYQAAIEAPEEQERIVIDTAQEVSKQLYFHPSKKASFSFNGRDFRATYHTRIENFKKKIFFVAFDVKRPTVPIVAEAEVENGLTELENLRAVIAAFLRHLIGTQRAEILDDDEGGTEVG